MKDDTKIIAAGRPHRRPFHPVNPVVERASTFIFPTVADFREGSANITYGRLGTSTHRALEEAITLLEGGYETRLAPSGLQACVAAILAFVEAGDHVLMADCVYDPTRKFCDRFLKRFGVETTYFAPDAPVDEIAAMFTDKTRVLFIESPGSLTFEVQDLPALSEQAHKRAITVVADNTWSGGYFCKPLSLGADVSVQAVTKYIAGHSDCLLGSITSSDDRTAKKVFHALLQLGSNVSADDAYLALRGIRTLGARMKQHEANGLALAKWLKKRPEIDTILHPAFKSCPGHSTWKRDFSGASGLFSIVLEPIEQKSLEALLNTFKLFGLGFSWGGFESLCIPSQPEKVRTASKLSYSGPLLRVHAGLEDIDDMIADWENAFLAAAAKR